MAVSYERRSAIAYVILDNPPVNAIGLSVREGLIDALKKVESEVGLERVVLTGSTRAFAAGGDAREFDRPPVAPHLPDVVAQIERSRVPWVAAISGVAFGGGAEIALGCQMRICATDALVGFPEVTLGVVPGAGATQRLPRLVGLASALDLIATGKAIGANQALSLGLIDEISADPVERASQIEIPGRPAVSKMPAPSQDEAAKAKAIETANKKRPNEIAPHVAIKLVEASVDVDFDEAMRAERDAFINLRTSPQAKALRHLFFAERGAGAPKSLRGQDFGDLGEVAVVGGGTMGAGIAYACLRAGLIVTLLETSPENASNAKANVAKIIEASRARNLISANDADGIASRLTTTVDYERAANADLAIEAAFESMEVKKTIFAALEAVFAPDVPIATNTSYLDVNEIATAVDDPSRVLGLHFFAPAHIMKLLEIVEGEETSEVALAKGFALAKKLRKIPVQAGVCDGFIGNRILARSRLIADDLLLRGALPQDVDGAMERFGYAMGPYAVQDLSGLDIGYANRRRLDATRLPDDPYVAIADKMVGVGRLGRKTQAGWYDYENDGPRPSDAVREIIEAESKRGGVERVRISPDEISHRMILSMINEAANILADGVALCAADIDLVTHFGYGFPRWRGGLMHYGDTLGARAILRDLRELQDSDGYLWTPSPMIEAMVAMGTTFADYRAP